VSRSVEHQSGDGRFGAVGSKHFLEQGGDLEKAMG